ncbi:MAG: hypothetical protein K2L97_01630 [Muribaculaceae bacterium]|nr:hypothetical protein [Muribaculaceae bacterium]
MMRLRPYLLTGMVVMALTSGAQEAVSQRSMTEDRFISRLRSWPATAEDDWSIDIENAVDYRDSLVVLRGSFYHVPQVNNNTYYIWPADADPGVLLDSYYPAESIANLFLLPLDEGRDVILDLTFATHDYGSSVKLSTTVDKFVSLCQADGCEVYFGVESCHDNTFKGSLFMYNRADGYDHVVRLECDPVEVIDGAGHIKGRVSLFVPTDNVRNIFQPVPVERSKAREELDRQINPQTE